MLGLAGVTAMDVRVTGAGRTESVALPLMPSSVAVTVSEPEATAVTMPPELIVATVVLLLLQVTPAVTSAVVPSLYAALASNCSVAPTSIVVVFGVVVMEVRDFAVIGLALELPQPAIASMSEIDTKAHDK
jgi:hypothetical protein